MITDLLVLLHLEQDRLDLGEWVVVRPHHAPVVRQVVAHAHEAGAVQHCKRRGQTSTQIGKYFTKEEFEFK